MSNDLYEVLGVNQDASSDEIKRAYHDAVRRFHPDVNPDPDSTEFFLTVQEAFEVLNDPERRKKFDEELANEKFVQPVTRLKIKKSCTAITRMNEEQLVYGLMEIECLKTSQEVNWPRVHVCLVIDRSTSMAGSRIDMVKANVCLVLKKLNSSDLLSIITFSDDADVFLSPTPVTDQATIENRIRQIQTGGSTEIRKGIMSGIDLLWQSQKQGYSSNLILLTDGHTYGDEEDCFDLAQKASAQGITISAMGIGSKWNEVFLEKLTAITGGSTVLINSKDALSHYMERIFETVDYVYAKKMSLYVEKDSRVEIRYIFQLEPNIVQYEVNGPRVFLGDLYFGKKSIFLIEFLIHPLIKKDMDVELLKGQIKMELPHESHVKARLFLNENLPIVEDVMIEDRPPDEIVRALSKITMYYMQERSREDVQSGSYVRATRRLNYLATKLISEGEVKLAGRVLSESNHIINEHKYSPDGEKELKYGTKQLLALPNP